MIFQITWNKIKQSLRICVFYFQKGQKIAFSFFGCLLLVAMITGCSEKGQKQSHKYQVQNGKYLDRPLRLGLGSLIHSLDPRIGSEGPTSLMIKMLYERLMHMDSSGKAFPALAERYTISEDQKTYTFYLRPAKWSNGEPVTAYDFEYAWKKSVNPQFAQKGAYTFYIIKNVAACLENKVNVEEIGVKALDDKTLVVELEHPAPYFLSLTACSTYAPICKKLDQEDPNWAHRTDGSFVSNGPFCIKEWKHSQHLYLEKNATYWDAEHIFLPEIHLYIIPDPVTQYYMYEKGELDWIGEPLGYIPLDMIGTLKTQNKLNHYETAGILWLLINTNKFPFYNKNLRKALAYAIDRKSITEHITQLGERPATGILGSILSLRKTPYYEDNNLDLAKEYFEKALQELNITRKDFPPITISARTHSDTDFRMIQSIQQQWQQVFNIEVKLQQTEWIIYLENLSKGEFDVGSVRWVSWICDPIYFLDTFRDRTLAINMCRWEHPLYKKHLQKADHEIDPEKRKRILQKAEMLLMDEMPIIPIHYLNMTFMHDHHLKNVFLSPLREVSFTHAYFSAEEEEACVR